MDTKQLIIKANAATNQQSDLEALNYGKNAPPDYDKIGDSIFPPMSSNLFKSVTYVKETTNQSVVLFKKLAAVFFCSATIFLILFILMALPVIMITVGSLYIHQCSIQKMIPIWLIVFGSLLVIKNISTLIQRIRSIRSRGEEKISNRFMNVFDSFIALFLIIWFVCGNIWVYSNHKLVQYLDPTDASTYCNQVAYLVAFWMITLIYVLVMLACVLFCCTICVTIFIPEKK